MDKVKPNPLLRRPATKWLALGVLVFGAWILALHLRTGGHNGGVVHLRTMKTEAPSGMCHVEEHAEYQGDMVLAGHKNFQASVGDCCESCHKNKECNVWVWCGNKEGCEGSNGFGHCALKKQQPLDLLNIKAARKPEVAWTSGGSYSDSKLQTAQQAEAARIEALVKDEKLPMVWMDINIQDKPAGRITFVLFSKDAPMAAENFRALCTGEKGVVPEGHLGAGRRYHFKGNSFYRIIHGFIDQTGAETDSVFGGQFKDDPGGLLLKHDRKGLLSMANTGHDTNDSHFSIMMGPQSHLDGKHPIFGEVVSGFEVVEAINNLSIGKKDNTAGREVGAVIVDSGQIRCGAPCSNPELYKKKDKNEEK